MQTNSSEFLDIMFNKYLILYITQYLAVPRKYCFHNFRNIFGAKFANNPQSLENICSGICSDL